MNNVNGEWRHLLQLVQDTLGELCPCAAQVVAACKRCFTIFWNSMEPFAGVWSLFRAAFKVVQGVEPVSRQHITQLPACHLLGTVVRNNECRRKSG